MKQNDWIISGVALVLALIIAGTLYGTQRQPDAPGAPAQANLNPPAAPAGNVTMANSLGGGSGTGGGFAGGPMGGPPGQFGFGGGPMGGPPGGGRPSLSAGGPGGAAPGRPSLSAGGPGAAAPPASGRMEADR